MKILSLLPKPLHLQRSRTGKKNILMKPRMKMEALYPRLYIICIFGAEIYKCYGKKYYFASNGYGLKQENNE